jgi:hypothetical protein
MIATEICTVGPTDRAVNVTSYEFLSTYGYDFQSVILIFFKTNTLIVPQVCM